MNSSHNDYVSYIADLLLPLGNIKIKQMFGGHGIYHFDVFFALIAQDVLYFKVNETNRANFQAHESTPFTYPGKDGKIISMNYWQVPPDILEDTHTLEAWARKAIKVAQAAKTKKAK